MSQELEQSIAGSLMIDPTRRLDLVIDPADMEVDACRTIVALAHNGNSNFDPMIIRADAKAQNLYVPDHSELNVILNTVPTAANFNGYQEALMAEIYKERRKALRKDFSYQFTYATDIITLAQEVTAKEEALSRKYLPDSNERSLEDVAMALVDDIVERKAPQGLVRTYVDFIDHLSGGGYLPNEYVVIAARPGSGKTALAIQVMIERSINSETSSFFSLEMDSKQVAARIVNYASKTSLKTIMRDPANASEFSVNSVLSSADKVQAATANIIIHEQADQNIEFIRRQARADVKKGSTLIVIDYLQLMSLGKSQKRNEALGDVSNKIKNMAKELGVPVIVLSQMNRNIEAGDRLPKQSDLKDTGSIEQDANVILFIHSKELGEASGINLTLFQAKGRDSGIGFAKIRFNKIHQTFYKILETENT